MQKIKQLKNESIDSLILLGREGNETAKIFLIDRISKIEDLSILKKIIIKFFLIDEEIVDSSKLKIIKIFEGK